MFPGKHVLTSSVEMRECGALRSPRAMRWFAAASATTRLALTCFPGSMAQATKLCERSATSSDEHGLPLPRRPVAPPPLRVSTDPLHLCRIGRTAHSCDAPGSRPAPRPDDSESQNMLQPLAASRCGGLRACKSARHAQTGSVDMLGRHGLSAQRQAVREGRHIAYGHGLRFEPSLGIRLLGEANRSECAGAPATPNDEVIPDR
jgi:hypothetical protein